jgi:hypothetical protein
MGHAGSLPSACSAAAKIFAMSLEREQQAQSVSDDQEHGQRDAEFLGQRGAGHQIGLGDCGRTHKRNCGQEEQTRVETGGSAVVLLDMVLETTEKERCSKHEKRVGHNSAGYGAFHKRMLASSERRSCNDQFCEIPERSVE